MEGSAPRMMKMMIVNGLWMVGSCILSCFPLTPQYCVALEYKKGSGVRTLMAKVSSTTSKLTESQEMAKDMFNGTYCKHSNLSSSLKAFKICGTLPENNAYKKILLKSTL